MYVNAHLIVSGHVQGVGYRYFVSHLARQMSLTGWVRNISGGRVEIEVEGQRGLIESMIADLRIGNSYARVSDIHVEWREFTGKYRAFDVTF